MRSRYQDRGGGAGGDGRCRRVEVQAWVGGLSGACGAQVVCIDCATGMAQVVHAHSGVGMGLAAGMAPGGPWHVARTSTLYPGAGLGPCVHVPRAERAQPLSRTFSANGPAATPACRPMPYSTRAPGHDS